MTPRLTTNYAKIIVIGHLLLVILENVVTCFLLGHSVYLHVCLFFSVSKLLLNAASYDSEIWHADA